MSSSDEDDFDCYSNTAAILAKAYSNSKFAIPMEDTLTGLSSDEESSNNSQKLTSIDLTTLNCENNDNALKQFNSNSIMELECPNTNVEENTPMIADCKLIDMSTSQNDISGVLAKIDACIESSTTTRGRRGGRRGRINKQNSVAKKKPARQPRRSSRRGRWQQMFDFEEDHNLPPLFAKDTTQMTQNKCKKNDTKQSSSSATDLEEANQILIVKVWWRLQKVDKFEVRRFQKFDTIFEFYAKQENISEDHLFFQLKEKIVRKDDTPDSLDLEAGSIIEGGLLAKSLNAIGVTSTEKNQVKVTEQLAFKIQQMDTKKPILVTMKRSECMVTLLAKVSEELKLPVGSFQLYFDGDPIEAQLKPEDLELEGGECLDLKITR